MWGDCRGGAAKGGYRGEAAKGGYRGGFAKGEGPHRGVIEEGLQKGRAGRSPFRRSRKPRAKRAEPAAGGRAAPRCPRLLRGGGEGKGRRKCRGRGRRSVQTLRKNKGYLLQAGGAAGKIEPSGLCFFDNERPETGTFFFAVRGGSDGIFQPAVCVPVFGA